MRVELALFLLLVGCSSDGLAPAETSYGLGCYLTVKGAFTGNIVAGGAPSARAFIGGPEIDINCRNSATKGDGALIAMGAGDGAVGPYSTFATLQTNADADDCAGNSSPKPSCNTWFQGKCTGNLLAAASHVGSSLRGTFSCESLMRAESSETISIVDGNFDLQLEMAPPE